ncbi:putative bifunctional diguanylate cyclase/phosphodiesterase [Lichenicoccus sp.]|uniref:putative bifunctional diguanylate cyclase/phosphodiesterase n=1 Tax=Lichenicoccus sp. TaxID=2781899 RepID=UPI003D151DBC
MRLLQAARDRLVRIVRRQPAPSRYHAAAYDETLRAAARLTPYCMLTSGMVALVLLPNLGVGLIPYRYGLTAIIEIVVALAWLTSWRAHRALRGRISDRDRDVHIRMLMGLSLTLGLAWSTMPVMLFGPADANMRVMIACTCAGLIATSLVMMPIFAASEALAIPLILGSFLALHRTGIVLFQWLAVLLGIYAVFIILATNAIRLLFERYTLMRLQQDDQQDIIQLLLGDVDQRVSRWLWETDAEGRLRFVTPGLGDALERPLAWVEGRRLIEIVRAPRYQSDGMDVEMTDASKLAQCMRDRVVFRSITAPVRRHGTLRWWSLTGRPVFDENAHFIGYRGVGADITEARGAEARASHQARHDLLTSLPNRQAFTEALRAALKELGRRSEAFALMSIDLDGFKAVNDSMGHAAGDVLLQAAARRLDGCIGGGGLLARIGGDEFMLLQRNTTVTAMQTLAECLLKQFEHPFLIDERDTSIGLSIGVSMAPLAGDTGEALLEAADLALYQAKHDGGGCFRFYDTGLKQIAQEQRALLRDLREAIAEKGIVLAYQPIVDAQTYAIRGFEALARWRRPNGGSVSPDRFIRLAEEAGLIEELGGWILEHACQQAATWPDMLKVAVNISVGQLSGRSFIQQVSEVLRRTGLAPHRLELEITESIFMDADTSSFGVLEGLRDLGVGIALDDFGRGFSSLGFLRGFAFSKIKMDMSFVRDMIHDRRSAAVVHAVVGLAADLGVVVTAEGVETVEQLDQLRRQGCTEIQGFLFSRAMSAERIPDLLEELRRTGSPEPDAPADDYVFDLTLLDETP